MDPQPKQPPLVGDSRIRLVDGLLALVDQVEELGEARWVSLEAPSGWGKTRVAQEIYARLAARQTDLETGHYWPTTTWKPSTHRSRTPSAFAASACSRSASTEPPTACPPSFGGASRATCAVPAPPRSICLKTCTNSRPMPLIWTPPGSRSLHFGSGTSRPWRRPGDTSDASSPRDWRRTRNNIACWCAECGQIVAALAAYEELLGDQERILGGEHPKTLTTRGNIAHWRAESGR